MHEDIKMAPITTSPSEEKIEESPVVETSLSEDIDFKKVAEDLDRKTPRPRRSKEDEIAFNLRKNAERAKEAGLDPRNILGFEENSYEEPRDSQFVTKEDLAQNYAKDLASSSDEAKVIMWHYRHSIQKTGNIQDDIENAHWLANKGKLKSLKEEITRSNVVPPKGAMHTASQMPRIDLIPDLPNSIKGGMGFRVFKFVKPGLYQAKHNQYRYDQNIREWVYEKIIK